MEKKPDKEITPIGTGGKHEEREIDKVLNDLMAGAGLNKKKGN